eukprot:652682_1
MSQFTSQFYATLCKLMSKLCAIFKASIPRGIALNRSLQENLFLLFTCIMTKTPLILVGKPGSSKTLAMAIIRDYFSSTKNLELLKAQNLSPIHVVSFQCSAQSRADGIAERWHQTVKLGEDNKDMIYVLLLDEIGLAEHSPYRPLKVLHQLLEIDPAPISFVGLSNWALDAAKMNRAVMHCCPIHKVYDLRQTAKAMAQQFTASTSNTEMDKVQTKLALLSDVYDDVMNYKNLLQPRYDFFGARDFYSVVRHFLSSLNDHVFHSSMDQNEQLIMYFLRNFGGINYGRIDGSFNKFNVNKKGTSLNKLIKKHLGILDEVMISKIIEKYSPSALVELNLKDKRSTHATSMNKDAVQCDNFLVSRHVMVITEYANSWNVLLDLQIINYHHNIFIFGSEFERDLTANYSNIYLYLNRIKNCMETGKTLILCHLEEIHESLYDMLNQRYTFRKTDGKMYCRIALGSNSQTCFVDPAFKCIVITNKKDAHRETGVPIAFLNRFEKQLISYYSSLSDSLNMKLLNNLKERIYSIYHLTNRSEFKLVFPGFCRDTLPSIVLNVYKQHHSDSYLNDDILSKKTSSHDFLAMSSKDLLEQEKQYNQDILSSKSISNIMDECCVHLLDVTLPQALIQTTIASKKAPIKYLPTLEQIISNHHQDTANNKLLMILTFDFQSKLNKTAPFLHNNQTIIRRMTQFGKSDEFETFIYRFLRSKSHKTLLLQYRHRENGINHLIHIKHSIISLIRKTKHAQQNKIILLVHLYRDPNLYSQFPLIFSESLKIIFLDSLTQQTPIELAEFAHQTIKQVMSERGVALLKRTFQRSLSHLSFGKQIEIEDQIERLQGIFDADHTANNNKYYAVQDTLCKRFLQLLSDEKINRKIAEVVCDSISFLSEPSSESITNENRGSLYERLDDIIDRIGVVAMIHVLQPLFENNNIALLDNTYFGQLYASFDLIEEVAIKESMQEIVNKKPNSLHVKHEYDAQFPFSSSINEWCCSHKEREDQDLEEEEDGKDDTKEDINAENNPNMIEFDFLKMNKFKNDKTKHVSSFLMRQMENKLPLSLCNLPTNALLRYSHDMIWIYRHRLSLDAATLDRYDHDEFTHLCSKLLLIITSLFCHYHEMPDMLAPDMSGFALDADLQMFAHDETEYKNPFLDYDEEDDAQQTVPPAAAADQYDLHITIAELEATMWTQSKTLYHLIRLCSVFECDDNAFEMVCDHIMQCSYGTQSFLNLISFVLDKLLHGLQLGSEIYKTFNLLDITSSIQYILKFIDLHALAMEDNQWIVKSNMIKVKSIALKNGLNAQRIDCNKLLKIMQEDAGFVNKTKLLNTLAVLTPLITHDDEDDTKDKEERIMNDLLHDVLALIEDNDIVRLTDDDQMMEFAQFLIDLLCQNMDDLPIPCTLGSTTEYIIVCKLFIVLSKERVLSNDSILNQIKNGRSELNGMIIQIMSNNNDPSNKKKKKAKMAQCVRNKSEFNADLSIKAPLIALYNKEVFNECMDSISIDTFLSFFRNKMDATSKASYPVLEALSRQSALFVDGLQHLFDITQWIRLVHSKYQGTLTTSSCNKIKMNDVFGHVSLNKWGDENEWKAQYERFETGMNHIRRDTPNTLDASHFKVPIASCLMSKKSGVKLMDDNFEMVTLIINSQNEFLNEIGQDEEGEEIDLFNLLPQHLISIAHIERVIRSNSKPWICYDALNELQPETYLLFDFERIERQMSSECIASRHQLNIDYQNASFAFIGNKNMLQLIRSLQHINQQILNYEIWHAFDKQFESNIERKKALQVVEDVISLLSYSINKKQNRKTKTKRKKKKKKKKKFGNLFKLKRFQSKNKKEEVKDMEQDDDNEEEGEEEKDDVKLNIDPIEEDDAEMALSVFMKRKLKFNSSKCNLFRLEGAADAIKLCHIQSIWSELMKRIEGEHLYYADQCYICFDWIGAMTPIELECCGLKLHYECLVEYVESKFLRNDGRRITLKQLSCLMCKRQMIHKSAAQLFAPIDELYEKVKRLVLNRLELDDKMNDDEAMEDPLAYAIKLYSCFICFECKNPYYGGLNDCGGGFLEDKIDPKERLCSACGVPQNYETQCNEHGDEYIQWKCRFCCGLATFFCFGTTHFCESCHCKAHQLVQTKKGRTCAMSMQIKSTDASAGDCRQWLLSIANKASSVWRGILFRLCVLQKT